MDTLVDLKGPAQKACRAFMKPIIRFLLRNGVSFGEFAEMCKQIYVEVAGSDFGIKGRLTNASRVSILTGISRKEVHRLRESAPFSRQEPEASRSHANRATRVLSGWHQDPEFLDDDGNPLVLPVDGAAPSFAALLQRFGGDLPPTALLKELKAVGAVADAGPGKIRALTRYYMPAQLDPALIEHAGEGLRQLAGTLNHNLFRKKRTVPRFEGIVSNDAVSPEAAKRFAAYVADNGQKFLELLDDWLSIHELEDHEARVGPSVRTGVGIYLFEETRVGGDHEREDV